MGRNTKQPVVIVGAGPTGLMAACQLAARGVNVRIIEKLHGPTNESRALVVQARSLEIFEQMGIIGSVLELGQKVDTVNLFINGHKRATSNFGDFGYPNTKYPYLLICEQSKTERILLNLLSQLGGKVEWDTEVTSLVQDRDSVRIILQKTNAEQESVETPWLIGCDGAHSSVRKFLDVQFEGATYAKNFFVLDCKTDVEIPRGQLNLCFGGNDFGLIVHLKDSESIRVIGTMPAGHGKEIEFSDVYPSLFKKIGLQLRLKDPKWISAYHAHHRNVDRFRVGHCFLAGDAAHIHSPLGAQGMNTGLQDTYNLSWKLAMVIHGQASESLLDTYHEERIKIARQLVQTTDKLFKFVIGNNKFVQFLRLRIFPWVMKFVFSEKQLRLHAFGLISELGLSYEHSSLSITDGQSNFPKASPKPGDRAPIVLPQLMPGQSTSRRFQLLIFGGNKQVQDFMDQMSSRWSTVLDMYYIEPDKQKAYATFGIEHEGFYIIRPDGYVGYRRMGLDADKVDIYLDKIGMTTQAFTFKKSSSPKNI